MKTDESYHYSGPNSKQFWMRVNKLKGEDVDRIYNLGCALQAREQEVLEELRKAEQKLEKPHA